VDDRSIAFAEAAPVGVALAFSGNAVRLAREASNNDVHQPAKRPSIEFGKAREYRRCAQGFLLAAVSQDRAGECFPLDVSNGAHSEAHRFKSKLNAESEHPDACAKFERIEDGTIHIHAVFLSIAPMVSLISLTSKQVEHVSS